MPTPRAWPATRCTAGSRPRCGASASALRAPPRCGRCWPATTASPPRPGCARPGCWSWRAATSGRPSGPITGRWPRPSCAAPNWRQGWPPAPRMTPGPPTRRRCGSAGAACRPIAMRRSRRCRRAASSTPGCAGSASISRSPRARPRWRRFLARGLPAADAALANDYAAFVDAPHPRAATWPRDERSRRVAAEGLSRLAKRDQDAARAQLASLAPVLDMGEAHRGQVLYQIALWTVDVLPARRRGPPGRRAGRRLRRAPARVARARGHEPSRRARGAGRAGEDAGGAARRSALAVLRSAPARTQPGARPRADAVRTGRQHRHLPRLPGRRPPEAAVCAVPAGALGRRRPAPARGDDSRPGARARALPHRPPRAGDPGMVGAAARAFRGRALRRDRVRLAGRLARPRRIHHRQFARGDAPLPAALPAAARAHDPPRGAQARAGSGLGGGADARGKCLHGARPLAGRTPVA